MGMIKPPSSYFIFLLLRYDYCNDRGASWLKVPFCMFWIWYWISLISEMHKKFFISSNFWPIYRRYFQLFAENGFVWENLHLNRPESKSRGPLGGVNCCWFKGLLAVLSKMFVVSNSSRVCTLSLPDGAVTQYYGCKAIFVMCPVLIEVSRINSLIFCTMLLPCHVWSEVFGHHTACPILILHGCRMTCQCLPLLMALVVSFWETAVINLPLVQ